jgi:thiosulfate dehydrogenase
MADMYDRFTGLLLPFELRQMQCFINSSNGYKPNIADDLIRDVTAYSRFLSAAWTRRSATTTTNRASTRFPHRPRETGRRLRSWRGLFKQKCHEMPRPQAFGVEANGRVVAPALAGPNAWNMQSRNYFHYVSTILPGFICRNMPLGEENTLSNQECRDIAYYISNLPRPAGDRQGPIRRPEQQLLMAIMHAAPADSVRSSSGSGHREEERSQ